MPPIFSPTVDADGESVSGWSPQSMLTLDKGVK